MIILKRISNQREDKYETPRMGRVLIGLKRRIAIGINPVLWQRLRPLPVHILAAKKSSHERFVFRPTCTFIMEHSPSSVLIQTVARPLVRSKT